MRGAAVCANLLQIFIMQKILFLDTTLRDGEQTPGVYVNRSGKLEIARALEQLGVDIIEAGFPAASNGDFGCVAEIARTVRTPVICGLARCVEGDIEAAAEALKSAERKRINLFIASSPIHMEYKLRMTPEQVERRVAECVSKAREYFDDIEFSCEDATRSDVEFLIRLFEIAAANGATTLNIPDTVGYACPPEFGALVKTIKENVKGAENCVISSHCHDDLGMGVANSLAAIENGALQVECTINGVGERAGNAALEEIAMAIKTRADCYDRDINLDTTQLYRVSRLVSSLYGVPNPPNKPIVGSNCFLHESGIHQHGVMMNRSTYEIMTPESVGMAEEGFVLGKLSGRHAFSQRLSELGYQTLSDEAITLLFARFKDYADKKSVTDEDIMAIVNEYLDSQSPVYALETFQIQSGNNSAAMAMVSLSCRGAQMSEAALGDGPIDAAFNAIHRLSGAGDISLEEFEIRAVTEGTDALGEAKIRLNIDGVGFTGRSVSPDIIEACIRAYINALNKWAAT